MARAGRRIGCAVVAALVAGCAGVPVVPDKPVPHRVTVYGLPYCPAGETCNPLTDDQQRGLLQRILDKYGAECPVG